MRSFKSFRQRKEQKQRFFEMSCLSTYQHINISAAGSLEPLEPLDALGLLFSISDTCTWIEADKYEKLLKKSLRKQLAKTFVPLHSCHILPPWGTSTMAPNSSSRGC